MPSRTDDRWNDAQSTLVEAARKAEVDVAILVKIAGFESGYNPTARPISSNSHQNRVRQFDGVMAISSAYGYGQFLDGTWREMIRQHGEKYGIANASSMSANDAALRNDPELQAAMLAEFTRDNIRKGARLGGPDADANVYAFHNLGEGDAARFLHALMENSSQRVDSILSANVIRGNPALYGDGSRSIADAYQAMGQQMARYDEYALAAQALIGDETRTVAGRDAARAEDTSRVSQPPGLGADCRLSSGSSGTEVRHLQQLLNTLDYRDAHGQALAVDGGFGDRTGEAVRAFQQAHGLEQIGQVGPKTLAALREAQRAPTPVDPAHPDHALYRQTVNAVQGLDRELGRNPDAGNIQLAASLTRLARENGLTHVDHVVLSVENEFVRKGANVFVVQGALDDPAHLRAQMRTQLALDTPVAESFRQLDVFNQRQHHEPVQQHQVQSAAQGHPQHYEYRDGPRMIMAP